MGTAYGGAKRQECKWQSKAWTVFLGLLDVVGITMMWNR